MTAKPDITALAIELNTGALTASALLDQHLRAFKLHQSNLNCFVSVDIAAVKRAAIGSDARLRSNNPLSPLDGIPIALKDNIHVPGMVTRNGTRLEFPFKSEANVVKKLRAAGAVILGKLNMDECALGATTDNPHHKRTHNPWQIGHIPGGSSGGAGAAVSGGLSMAALGTDTLGSVRLPAAYCGIVGLKPTRGLISTNGVVPLCPTLDHVGPLSLSVRDAGMLLNIIVDETPEDWTCAPSAQLDLANSRIGVLDQIFDVDLTDEVTKSFDQVKTDLQNQGATLVSVSIDDFNMHKLRQAAFLVIEVEGAAALAEPLRTHPEYFSDGLKAMLNYGQNASLEKVESAYRYLQEIKKNADRIFDHVDFLVTPTAPQTAFAFDGPTPSNQADLTALANICGWPALSLPCGLDTSGLPLAAQFITPAFQESELLSFAMIMENIWGRFTPDIADPS